MTLLSRAITRAMRLGPPESRKITVIRDLAVPMRDGAVLKADHYMPRGHRQAPLLLVRSPYGRRGPFGTMFGRLFAERGFQVIVQSCRGTAGSGGTFDPFNERADGLDTVAWLRARTWYPGRFGTVGPSYLGLTQWAIADAGDDYAAMAIQVSGADVTAMMYQGGSFQLHTMAMWLGMTSHQDRRLAWLRQKSVERTAAKALRVLPLSRLDIGVAGRELPYTHHWWANHGDAEAPYWKQRRNDDLVGQVRRPVNLVGGFHDFFVRALLDDYRTLREAGQTPSLTLGPWRHADMRLLGESVRQSVAFLKVHLTDRPAPPPRVRVYVTGAEGWRTLSAWPPPAEQGRWHLHGNGRLEPETPADLAPSRFCYDPSDPTPTVGGAMEQDGVAVVDNRPLEARADVLTFTGARLARPLTVIGEPEADLFVRPESPYADLMVRLCEVWPDGRSMNVTDGLLRLDSRAATGKVQPRAAGVYHVQFGLGPMAHQFAAGNRIRLQIAGGAFPRFMRNPGTGDPVATAAKLVPVVHTVFHDQVHPSAVILPVCTPDGTGARAA